MAEQLRGWHPDPFGRHELRYFTFDAKPSRLVRDGRTWSHDALPQLAPSFLVASPARSLQPARPEHQGPWIPAPVQSTRPNTRAANAMRSGGASPWSGPQRREGRQGPEAGLRVGTLAPPLGATKGTSSLVTDRTPTSAALLADGTHFWDVSDHKPRQVPHPLTSEAEATANEETRGPRSALIRRFVRYGSVSAISTVISLVTLGILVGALGAPAVLSNVIATGVATGPSFELNRRWVWAQTGQRSIRRQAVPYFLLSFVGLIVSTVAVHVAADATAHSTRLVHTAAVEIATILSYGALWLVQFFLCDRLLFRVRPRGSVVLSHVAPS